MLTWMKRIKGNRSYLVSPEGIPTEMGGALPGKKVHVYTAKVLPNGKVVRVLDRQVHDQALRAASDALRKTKAAS
jgi:hypothetical protein